MRRNKPLSEPGESKISSHCCHSQHRAWTRIYLQKAVSKLKGDNVYSCASASSFYKLLPLQKCLPESWLMVQFSITWKFACYYEAKFYHGSWNFGRRLPYLCKRRATSLESLKIQILSWTQGGFEVFAVYAAAWGPAVWETPEKAGCLSDFML